MTARATTRDADELRAVLRGLAQRRGRMMYDQAALADDIREALRASAGIITKVEAATLLGIDRKALYTTYR